MHNLSSYLISKKINNVFWTVSLICLICLFISRLVTCLFQFSKVYCFNGSLGSVVCRLSPLCPQLGNYNYLHLVHYVCYPCKTRWSVVCQLPPSSHPFLDQDFFINIACQMIYVLVIFHCSCMFITAPELVPICVVYRATSTGSHHLVAVGRLFVDCRLVFLNRIYVMY